MARAMWVARGQVGPPLGRPPPGYPTLEEGVVEVCVKKGRRGFVLVHAFDDDSKTWFCDGAPPSTTAFFYSSREFSPLPPLAAFFCLHKQARAAHRRTGRLRPLWTAG